jgi:hypothetical protein
MFVRKADRKSPAFDTFDCPRCACVITLAHAVGGDAACAAAVNRAP